MTKSQIVRKFKKHKPKNAEEATALGLKLIHAGSGAFRKAYIINKHDADNRMVVKFPLTNLGSKERNLEHARHEIYIIRKINKTARYAALRPFLPAICYADYRHGVLLTDYYFKVGETRACIASIVLTQVSEAVFDDSFSEDRDIAGYNIMQTKEGKFKLIDLGLL